MDNKPRPPKVPADATVEDKRKMIQQQLVLLLHAHKCMQRDKEKDPNNPPQECSLPHCPTMKDVLIHIKTCTLKQKCLYPHCSSSHNIIWHWKSCRKDDCAVCAPLRAIQPRTPLRETTVPQNGTNGTAAPVGGGKDAPTSAPQPQADDPSSSSSAPGPSNIQIPSTLPELRPIAREVPMKRLAVGTSRKKVLSLTSSSDSSDPDEPLPYGPEFTRPEATTVRKDWHYLVQNDLRTHLIGKMAKAILPPPPDLPPTLDQQVKEFFNYARKVERDFFERANTKEEYYTLLAEKIFKIQKDIVDKRKARKLAEEEAGGSSNADQPGPSNINPVPSQPEPEAEDVDNVAAPEADIEPPSVIYHPEAFSSTDTTAAAAISKKKKKQKSGQTDTEKLDVNKDQTRQEVPISNPVPVPLQVESVAGSSQKEIQYGTRTNLVASGIAATHTPATNTPTPTPATNTTTSSTASKKKKKQKSGSSPAEALKLDVNKQQPSQNIQPSSSSSSESPGILANPELILEAYRSLSDKVRRLGELDNSGKLLALEVQQLKMTESILSRSLSLTPTEPSSRPPLKVHRDEVDEIKTASFIRNQLRVSPTEQVGHVQAPVAQAAPAPQASVVAPQASTTKKASTKTTKASAAPRTKVIDEWSDDHIADLNITTNKLVETSKRLNSQMDELARMARMVDIPKNKLSEEDCKMLGERLKEVNEQIEQLQLISICESITRPCKGNH